MDVVCLARIYSRAFIYAPGSHPRACACVYPSSRCVAFVLRLCFTPRLAAPVFMATPAPDPRRPRGGSCDIPVARAPGWRVAPPLMDGALLVVSRSRRLRLTYCWRVLDCARACLYFCIGFGLPSSAAPFRCCPRVVGRPEFSQAWAADFTTGVVMVGCRRFRIGACVKVVVGGVSPWVLCPRRPRAVGPASFWT